MRIKITRNAPEERGRAPGLLAVLSCALFPARWHGRPAPHLSSFAKGLPRLLYFRAKGCVVCGLIDMRVAQACADAGVALTIIDRHPPEAAHKPDEQPYDDTNILDADGILNTAYGVAIYPCFVLIGGEGRIVLKEVGANAKPEVFGSYLSQRFEHFLAPAP